MARVVCSSPPAECAVLYRRSGVYKCAQRVRLFYYGKKKIGLDEFFFFSSFRTPY